MARARQVDFGDDLVDQDAGADRHCQAEQAGENGQQHEESKLAQAPRGRLKRSRSEKLERVIGKRRVEHPGGRRDAACQGLRDRKPAVGHRIVQIIAAKPRAGPSWPREARPRACCPRRRGGPAAVLRPVGKPSPAAVLPGEYETPRPGRCLPESHSPACPSSSVLLRGWRTSMPFSWPTARQAASRASPAVRLIGRGCLVRHRGQLDRKTAHQRHDRRRRLCAAHTSAGVPPAPESGRCRRGRHDESPSDPPRDLPSDHGERVRGGHPAARPA